MASKQGELKAELASTLNEDALLDKAAGVPAAKRTGKAKRKRPVEQSSVDSSESGDEYETDSDTRVEVPAPIVEGGEADLALVPSVGKLNAGSTSAGPVKVANKGAKKPRSGKKAKKGPPAGATTYKRIYRRFVDMVDVADDECARRKVGMQKRTYTEMSQWLTCVLGAYVNRFSSLADAHANAGAARGAYEMGRQIEAAMGSVD